MVPPLPGEEELTAAQCASNMATLQRGSRQSGQMRLSFRNRQRTCSKLCVFAHAIARPLFRSAQKARQAPVADSVNRGRSKNELASADGVQRNKI
jgi:hypothetical protein